MVTKATLHAAAMFAATAAALKDIPALGLGTWLSDKDLVPHAVEFGLNNGYDHIDAAWIYRNENETGKGIAAADLPREDIWVTSKLWNSAHRETEAGEQIRESLAKLGLDYLDLYLVHWPVAFVPGQGTTLDEETSIVDTWRTLEGLVGANLTRHIGISNFAKKDVEAILEICEICPYAHEYETHPYLQQQDFLDYHDEKGIKVIAYSPLGNTNPTYKRHANLEPLLKDPFWADLAEKKNATPAQAVLAWGIQRGTIVIPKSTTDKHLLQNLVALDITFTDAELEEIAKQDKKARFSNPSKNWGVNLFSDLDDHFDDLNEDEL
ncbi:Alcohol dehydrogenase [NADP(+)] [Cytospora mali]|uniref:Alcohol dehydrogenase [NADP(+)] n=1 Tax=Cytospora mali TaxID=578113 RepID=A0A194UY36_CYTMA|nr:Alcohol dehydrogenase [NADP(+)] [Valsa mali var. pyri (nom. inval.)]